MANDRDIRATFNRLERDYNFTIAVRKTAQKLGIREGQVMEALR